LPPPLYPPLSKQKVNGAVPLWSVSEVLISLSVAIEPVGGTWIDH